MPAQCLFQRIEQQRAGLREPATDSDHLQVAQVGRGSDGDTECHAGPPNSQAPYGTGVAGIQGGLLPAGANPKSNAVGRACMNCHVMVHGSNSPAGAYLHR